MGTLREAVEEDKISFSKKQPSLKKLKLMGLIEKFLSNAFYEKTFLNMGGLEVLKEWIKKNRDGTYPILNQLTKVLDILFRLHLGSEHLKHSDIGGYVMDLSKNMKESKVIQKKANDIVGKWSRIIWEINTDYANIDAEIQNYKQLFTGKKRQRDVDDRDELEDEFKEEEVKARREESKDNNIYKHAMIPKKGMFDFVEKPMPNINESKILENKNRFHTLFGGKNKK
jgi:hypothetical protein